MATVKTTTIVWNDLVNAVNNASGLKFNDVAYRFSNEREFIRAENPYTQGFPYFFNNDGYFGLED